jgi:hypothetical protein
MDLSINEGTLVVTGGPGTSLQDAIVIRKTPKGLSAAGAEMMLLTQRYGKRNTDWTVKRQDLVRIDSKVYDTYQVVLADRSECSMYFEVSEWLARVNACR